jgi:hypothetical protein
LRKGDFVLSRDEGDPIGQNVQCRIEGVFVRRVQSLQIVTLRSSSGKLQTLHTTPEHPVYINSRGWVGAAETPVGDEIAEPSGATASVIASRREKYPDGILVYNFEVRGTHTYYVREAGSQAEPLWVHNAACVVSSSVRSRAVEDAWNAEAALVRRTGVGTRAWTASEIKELLKTGKVAGYVGHHINSVAASPLFAGMASNITFLTRAEHLAAHAGNWRIPTFGDFVLR